MKRSAALTPLSHDHHTALVTAKRIRDLKIESEREITEYWLAKREVIRTQLVSHFETEEQSLLPLLSEEANEMAERLRNEHAEMLAMLESEQGNTALAFSELLKSHVRFEERELFPWLEQQYGESALLETMK